MLERALVKGVGKLVGWFLGSSSGKEEIKEEESCIEMNDSSLS